jgi:hypothetical protein
MFWFSYVLEETFLTGNHLQSGEDDDNSNNHSFASLTRQIQNQFHLFDKNSQDDKTSQTNNNNNNLLAYLNCKHASI